jgi:hypothetical protein
MSKWTKHGNTSLPELGMDKVVQLRPQGVAPNNREKHVRGLTVTEAIVAFERSKHGPSGGSK